MFDSLPRNDNDSFFVAFEGIEACGKTLQVARLVDSLYNLSKVYSEILLSRDPTYGKYGLRIREILREEDDPGSSHAELLNLYVKDRREHQPLIKEALSKPAGVVIKDRYLFSTMAYQTAQKGVVGADRLRMFEEIVRMHSGILMPDLTIILRIPVEVSLKRLGRRPDEEKKFNGRSFQSVVAENYSIIGEQDATIFSIDGTKDPEEVHDDILSLVIPKLVHSCPDNLKGQLERDVKISGLDRLL